MAVSLKVNSIHDAAALLGVTFFGGFLVLLIRNLIKKFRGKCVTTPDPTGSLAQKISISNSSTGDYVNVFPPSQRGRLPQLDPQFANTEHVDLSIARKSLVKLQDDYRKAEPQQFIFSGFAISDIRSLGAFPDYSSLSGVPLPSPLKDFDIDKALPRPYRPFRWPYHQTMSLTKLDPDFWIELESTYRERLTQRQELYAQHGDDLLNCLPGAELACKELMEMVLQFLCARYPKQFEIRDKNMLCNHILGTTTDLAAKPPLHVLLHNVPEDFGIVLRDHETGRYVLRAGMVCSTVGWKLGQKIGMGLPDIHKPIPDYKEKMEFSMDRRLTTDPLCARFFTKMPTDKPIQRGSWGLEIGQPLFLPSDHPDFAHRASQNPNLRPEDIHLRVDWQTLRRLPLSGAIVFNFKALFTPLTELRDEPRIPSLVLKLLNEGKENLMKYKGTWHVEHVAKPALAEYERFQVETGLVEKDWVVQTLAEGPFFPGWERKWSVGAAWNAERE